MKLFYCAVEGGNFGDDLNLWLWDELIPGWRDWQQHDHLVGVGTILQDNLLPKDGRKLVLGSGAGIGNLAKVHDNPELWDIRAVRGPKTARLLGLDETKAVVDAATMLPRLERFKKLPDRHGTIFVPHHISDFLIDWEGVCASLGIEKVSPGGDADAVIRRIASAELVIAESMHAAIIADAFRVPWIGVEIARLFNRFKWMDWGESVGVVPQFDVFFPLLRRLPQRAGSASGAHHSGGAQGEAGKAAPPAIKPQGFRTRGKARSVMEWSAAAKLKSLAKRRGQLSSEERLNAQRDRFQDILETLKRENA
jgi:succinoglycan biosynthesis protein ExoV